MIKITVDMMLATGSIESIDSIDSVDSVISLDCAKSGRSD